MDQGVRRRYYEAISSYSNGVLEQVRREFKNSVHSFEEQLETHRSSVGAIPMFTLVE